MSSCMNCEPVVNAQLQAARDGLQADVNDQLDALRKRLCSEFDMDKQQALSRVVGEVEKCIVDMRNHIERCYERQRDELIQKLEIEQKNRLSAVKRRLWCSNCEEEATLYCCWLTSYCSVLCQKEHWDREHSSQCRHKQISTSPSLGAVQDCC